MFLTSSLSILWANSPLLVRLDEDDAYSGGDESIVTKSEGRRRPDPEAGQDAWNVARVRPSSTSISTILTSAVHSSTSSRSYQLQRPQHPSIHSHSPSNSPVLLTLSFTTTLMDERTT